MKRSIKELAKLIPVFLLVALAPLLALAQANTGLTGALATISGLLKSILPILVSLGVLYFVWGVIQYVIADGEEAKKKGRDQIIYGVIGLAVIISVWGLVNLLVQTLNLDNNNTAQNVDNLIVTPTTSSCTVGTNFPGILNYFTCIIGQSVIPFIFALAMVMFVWGAVKFFIINADEEAKRAQGKQFMIWGIIAITVMISVWGLVNLLGTTFNLRTGVLPTVSPR